MRFAIFILLFALTTCTARVEYPPMNAVVSSANAVNINTASVGELENLPHIGRKTAEAIVQFREGNGPFRRVEYLMQVRGISESRFAEIRHLLRTE